MLTAYVRNNRCVVELSHVTRPSGIQRLSFISESFNLNETVTVERKRKSETVKLDIFPAPWNIIPQILIGSEKRKLRVCNVPILLLLVTYCRRPFTGLRGEGIASTEWSASRSAAAIRITLPNCTTSTSEESIGTGRTFFDCERHFHRRVPLLQRILCPFFFLSLCSRESPPAAKDVVRLRVVSLRSQ